VKSIRTAQIRLPEKYADLTSVFTDLFTKVFSQFDIRDDGSVFVNSMYFDENEVLQIENSEIGEGTNINDGAKVTTQRVLPTINFANVGSVQSAIPITSFADATIATVSIAAHDVLYGGETVSYSAGEVIGVPVSTDVYIYADDADLDGGAVTYEFTTDFTVLAEAKERYRVGAIRTPISSISAAVSAATNANPCAVTTGAAHGLSTSDVVDFSSVGGMTELNTGAYTITVTSPTSFTLNSTDSTGFGVYTSGGTVTRVSTPADGIGGAGADGSVYNIGFYY
jgi:hypothetical protein